MAGGIFWIGTNTGLYSVSNETAQPVKLNADAGIIPVITVVYSDDTGNIWIGTQQDGVYYYTDSGFLKPRQFVHSMYNPYSLSGNQVQYIYTDNGNNLWISIWGKGIDYVNLNKFRFDHYLTEQETNKENVSNFIRSIIEVNENELWCGTQLNGILVLNKDKKIIRKISSVVPPSIEHLYKDTKNNIWIATQQGLFVCDAGTKKITRVGGFENYPKAVKQFNYVSELNSGQIMVSSNSGIFLIKKQHTGFSVTQAKGIVNLDVYSTNFQDDDNNIYLCKAFKGFGIYTLVGDSFILRKDFYNQSTVKCYTQQNDSIIWIATTKGLIKFNKKKSAILKTYQTADGLPNQYIYSIIPDAENLWLTSNGGITKYSIRKNEFKNFTISDGLQSREFNTYSFCKTKNGEMLFGGVNGLNAFYPDKITKYLNTSDVLLQKLFINDTVARFYNNPEELQKLELPYNQNTISFQFAVMDYSNANDCRILYKLEGYDRDWISTKNKSLIRYANMPSEKYILNARAVNAEGVISDKIYKLSITIKTPWNKTWWFFLFVIASIASLFWLIIHAYYQRKIQQQKAILEKQKAVETERTRIATDMHDDLGSGLTKITYLSQMALYKENNKEDLDNIKKTSTELVENMSEIIWAMKEENNSLQDLLTHIKTYAYEYCSSNNLECSIKISETLDTRIVKGENRRNIFLAVKEILHNIVKHAQAKNVLITVLLDNGWTIHIKDDGIGVNAAQKEKIFGGHGLKNIHSRIKSVGGQVEIIDNNGTEVVFHIPF
jgi:signal transduction histidine kinase/streptogramin lyase